MTETEQWHKDRLNGIGGSEAAVVLGISPFKSRLELWYEKVNKIVPNDESLNLIFDIGHALEPIIANHWSKKTGRIYEKRPILIHPEHSFMFANIDGKIIKSERPDPGILEIKTKGAFVNWHDEEIVPYYITQIQHYMAVYNYNWGSFAVLDLGKREITYTDVERDDNLINKIIEEEKKFWKLVQDKTPPEPEYNELTEKFLKDHFNKAEPITIDVSDNIEASKKAETLRFIKSELKNLDAQKTEQETYFMYLMKEANELIGNSYRITWKNDKDSTKFDMDKFKLENPQTYKKYLEPKKGTRRFLFKSQI